MSNRTLRVNELIQRELSDILHRRYQAESVAITLTEVRVAPDLRDARLFVCVVGDDETVEKQVRWFRARLPELRMELGRRIVLKHMPRFTVAVDHSSIRGGRILQVLDELGQTQPPEEKKGGES